MEDSGNSPTERYKLESDDDDSRNWARLLDFESPVKVESDWYSTQTFQVFLDALDINQPTRLGGKNSISNGSSSAIPTQNDKHHQQTLPSNTDKDKTTTSLATKQDKTRQQQQQQQHNNFETILSAEALKILSELPDLSHMSATRSFIFPTATIKAAPSTKSTTSSAKR